MNTPNKAVPAQAASSTTERIEARLGEMSDIKDAESLAVWAAGFLLEKIEDFDRRLRAVERRTLSLERRLLTTDASAGNRVRLGDH